MRLDLGDRSRVMGVIRVCGGAGITITTSQKIRSKFAVDKQTIGRPSSSWGIRRGDDMVFVYSTS